MRNGVKHRLNQIASLDPGWHSYLWGSPRGRGEVESDQEEGISKKV